MPHSEPRWKCDQLKSEVRARLREGRLPIAILTKEGDLYQPISDKMPDYSQRKRLMPFVGKYVRVKGIAFERNGTHAIVITEITEMKEVHVTLQED